MKESDVRRPLGCLTFSALLAAIVVAVAILVAAVVTGNGIFSPGRLSAVTTGSQLGGVTSHAALEGRCDACHTGVLDGTRMADRCLVCHTQVGQELASASGLHGRFATTASCRGCHTDHRGASAALTLADPGIFPHERTGYVLTAHPLGGSGGTFGCRDCHPGSPMSFTPPACATCHEGLDATFMAEHEKTFGTTCLGCHDGVDTYGKAFTHSTYPLTGGHAAAPCGGCHQGATVLATLRATTTACIDCHAAKDIHQGRLGAACETCHTSADWTSAAIDHDRTRFPLVGRHVGTLCASCHVDRQWTGIGLTCQSCHAKDDPHAGQFKGDCASCHSATGWTDVTFDHAQTGFPLAAGHAKPACAACHAGGRYARTPTACIGCHAADDKHDGAFGRDCAACHTATTWSDWTFDHATSKFPLTGAHAKTTCQKCHAGGVFKGTPTACASCHTKPASHGSAFGGSCASCHSTKAWTPASFNGPHRFPMRHGGAGGSCAQCHPVSLTRYSCTGCHSASSTTSRHRGISGYSVSTCARCHPTGGGGD